MRRGREIIDRPSDRDPVDGDWLAGCVGYVVESDGGRIGRVADVRRDAASGRPLALVVRAGIAGERRLVVPVDEVAGVALSSGRIILAGSPSPTDAAQLSPQPAI